MKLYISVLNCIACLGVIFLHANSIFWGLLQGSFGHQLILLKHFSIGQFQCFL